MHRLSRENPVETEAAPMFLACGAVVDDWQRCSRKGGVLTYAMPLRMDVKEQEDVHDRRCFIYIK